MNTSTSPISGRTRAGVSTAQAQANQGQGYGPAHDRDGDTDTVQNSSQLSAQYPRQLELAKRAVEDAWGAGCLELQSLRAWKVARRFVNLGISHSRVAVAAPKLNGAMLMRLEDAYADADAVGRPGHGRHVERESTASDFAKAVHVNSDFKPTQQQLDKFALTVDVRTGFCRPRAPRETPLDPSLRSRTATATNLAPVDVDGDPEPAPRAPVSDRKLRRPTTRATNLDKAAPAQPNPRRRAPRQKEATLTAPLSRDETITDVLQHDQHTAADRSGRTLRSAATTLEPYGTPQTTAAPGAGHSHRVGGVGGQAKGGRVGEDGRIVRGSAEGSADRSRRALRTTINPLEPDGTPQTTAAPSASSSQTPPADHVRKLSELIADMDHNTEQGEMVGSVLDESWTLLKSFMPETPADWFARLETLDTMRDRVDELGEHAGRCHVLETTGGEFRDIWTSRDTVLDNLGVIVLRKTLEYPEAAANRVRRRLGSSYMHGHAEVQTYNKGPNRLSKRPWRDVVDRFAQREADTEAERTNDGGPINITSMGADVVKSVNIPESIGVMEGDLLSIVCSRLRHDHLASQKQEMTANPQTSDTPFLTDVESGLGFGLWAERGALSLSHLDLFNGTWATCLSGVKLWFVYQGPWDEETQADFRRNGLRFKPEKGTYKLVYLEPGDTIIMRCGFPAMHSVLTLDDSIMAGGIYWTTDSIDNILTNIEYIIDPSPTSHRLTVSELIPRQFPAVVDSLIHMAQDPVVADISFSKQTLQNIKAFKEKVRPVLSCTCRGRCEKRSCPCMNGGSVDLPYRFVRCTAWCHTSSSSSSAFSASSSTSSSASSLSKFTSSSLQNSANAANPKSNPWVGGGGGGRGGGGGWAGKGRVGVGGRTGSLLRGAEGSGEGGGSAARVNSNPFDPSRLCTAIPGYSKTTRCGCKKGDCRTRNCACWAVGERCSGDCHSHAGIGEGMGMGKGEGKGCGRCANYGEGSEREELENAELKGEVERLKDEVERLRGLVGEGGDADRDANADADADGDGNAGSDKGRDTSDGKATERKSDKGKSRGKDQTVDARSNTNAKKKQPATETRRESAYTRTRSKGRPSQHDP